MHEASSTNSGSDSDARLEPSPRRPLLHNTAYAIVGNGFYHACQLGVLVLLAKFASPEIQGQYFLALAIATPVVLFFGLELRGALVADAGNEFSFGNYRVLRRVMMFPAAIILLSWLLWQGMLGSPEPYLLILGGVFAAKIAWGLADLGWGTYQRRERLDLFATTVVLRGLTLIIPFGVLLPLYFFRISPEHRAEGTALAAVLHALGVALVLIFFDRPRVLDSRYFDLSWDWSSVRTLALQTLPLGVVALTINLCDMFPRYIIEMEEDGKRLLGYFGSLAYITLAGNLVILQAATAAANRISLFYQSDINRFLRLVGMLLGAALVIGAIVLTVAWLFGEFILRVLYTPEYASFQTEFQIIVLAHSLALLTNVFGTITTQMRLFWVQVPVQVITLGCTVLAAALLIPGPQPVFGAAITVLIRSIVQLVLYAVCVCLGLMLRQRILARKNVATTGD